MKTASLQFPQLFVCHTKHKGMPDVYGVIRANPTFIKTLRSDLGCHPDKPLKLLGRVEVFETGNGFYRIEDLDSTNTHSAIPVCVKMIWELYRKMTKVKSAAQMRAEREAEKEFAASLLPAGFTEESVRLLEASVRRDEQERIAKIRTRKNLAAGLNADGTKPDTPPTNQQVNRREATVMRPAPPEKLQRLAAHFAQMKGAR